MLIRNVLSFALLAGTSLFAADPRLLSMVPADVQAVAGVNVDRTATSPFGQFILRQMQSEDKEFGDFVAVTGFDPRRDLRELVFASGGAGKGVVLARGVFVPAKLIAFAQAKGAKVTQYSGIDVVSGGNDKAWFAFLDQSTAVAGDPELVKNAIDNARGSSRFDAKLAAKVNEISGLYDVWMVSNAPVNNLARRVPDRQVNQAVNGDMLKGIEQTSGGIVFGSEIRIAGEAVTRSPQDATALADVVRFLSGMVAMNRPQGQGANLAALLEALDLKTEGSTMKFTITVPETDLEKIFVKPTKAVPRKAA